MSKGKPSELIDLTGRNFGRLTVVERAPHHNKTVHWICQCACGTTKKINSASLKKGYTRSCGCLRKEIMRNKQMKHGLNELPEYNVWKGMWTRCRSLREKNYGGRGISVSEQWRDFQTFLRDMGRRPSPKHSIDRIDNDGNYESGNCRWADRKTQARNTRSNQRYKLGEREEVLPVYAEEFGIHVKAIENRLRLGWPLEKALTTPLKGRT